jgi:hypothetical protein
MEITHGAEHEFATQQIEAWSKLREKRKIRGRGRGILSYLMGRTGW